MNTTFHLQSLSDAHDALGEATARLAVMYAALYAAALQSPDDNIGPGLCWAQGDVQELVKQARKDIEIGRQSLKSVIELSTKLAEDVDQMLKELQRDDVSRLASVKAAAVEKRIERLTSLLTAPPDES